MKYDVFISVKSEDLPFARCVHEFLTGHNLRVFLSDRSLREHGSTDFMHELQTALVSTTHLVLVGSSLQNIESPWVEAEWGAFIKALHARKKGGNLVTIYTGELTPDDLPPFLGNFQAIKLCDEGLDELLAYVLPVPAKPPIPRPKKYIRPRRLLKQYRWYLFILAFGLFALYILNILFPEKNGNRSWLISIESPHSQKDSTTPKAGEIGVFGPSRMECLYVPAGEFTMGSDVPRRNNIYDERPRRQVIVDGFWIGKYEVTNRQFGQFVDATGYTGAKDWKTHRQDNDSESPARRVSWYDAKAYCQWAECRLPTEAEWEKAARGTDGRAYPWGNAWDVQTTPRCNFADNNTKYYWSDKRANDGFASVSPVGTYPKGTSPYGALDMGGNVQEWCDDWFEDGYYNRGVAHNPPGPDTGELKVVRGGSVGSGLDHIACTARGTRRPAESAGDTGFRVAITDSSK